MTRAYLLFSTGTQFERSGSVLAAPLHGCARSSTKDRRFQSFSMALIRTATSVIRDRPSLS